MGKKLSPAQQRVYDFIVEFQNKYSYPPSVREIGRALGLKSTSTVHAHLTTLEKVGIIRRDKSKTRAIVLLNECSIKKGFHNEIVELPVLGKIAAGSPIEAIENCDDYFPIPANILKSGTHFMLKVKGDSMINTGIYDGDLLIIKQTESAKNGDIVAAIIDDAATVKTFFKENGRFRLQAENDDMEDIIIDKVNIAGIVKGVFRTL